MSQGVTRDTDQGKEIFGNSDKVTEDFTMKTLFKRLEMLQTLLLMSGLAFVTIVLIYLMLSDK